MEEQRDADALAGAAERAPLPVVVAPRNRFAQDVEGRRIRAQHLARGRGVAGPQGVSLAQADRVDAQRLGDPLHVDVGGKKGLGRAEPPERAVGWRVGHHHPAVDAHVVAAVRPGRVETSARQDHGAQRAVRAAVHHHRDVHGRQRAVVHDAGAVPHDGRMALGGGQHVLDAVVDQLDRAARLQRQQRRVAGNDGRVVLLAAEPAARFRLDHAHLVSGEGQELAERLVHVVRALQRAVERDAALARHGQHAVRLDVEMFLVAGPVLALDDPIGTPESLVERALLYAHVLENGRRGQRIEHRHGGFVFDVHPRT